MNWLKYLMKWIKYIIIVSILAVTIAEATSIYSIHKVISSPGRKYDSIEYLIIGNWLDIDQRYYKVGDGPAIDRAFPDLTVLFGKGTLIQRYNVWVESVYSDIEKGYGKEALIQYKEKWNYEENRIEVIDFMKRTYDPNFVGE